MKAFTISFIGISLLILITPSCKNQNATEAGQLAKEIQSTAKKNTPGSVATSETGYYMKAKIDGKDWEAAFMVPDESASSNYKTVHGEKGESYMNFQLWRNGLEAGKAIPFSDEQVSNLSLEGVSGFWGGKKGQVKITKIDEQWIEGIFDFEATSSSSDKTIWVTEGRFRVPAQNVR